MYKQWSGIWQLWSKYFKFWADKGEGIFCVKGLNCACHLVPLKDYLKKSYQKLALLIAPSDTWLKKSCVNVDFNYVHEAKKSKREFFLFFLIY